MLPKISNRSAIFASRNAGFALCRLPGIAAVLFPAMLILVTAQLSCNPQDSPAAQVAPEEPSGYLANMVLVEGGSFMMGDVLDEGNENEKPARQAILDDFYLSPYEVTVTEFRQFVEDTGYITSAEGPKHIEKQM